MLGLYSLPKDALAQLLLLFRGCIAAGVVDTSIPGTPAGKVMLPGIRTPTGVTGDPLGIDAPSRGRAVQGQKTDEHLVRLLLGLGSTEEGGWGSKISLIHYWVHLLPFATYIADCDDARPKPDYTK